MWKYEFCKTLTDRWHPCLLRIWQGNKPRGLRLEVSCQFKLLQGDNHLQAAQPISQKKKTPILFFLKSFPVKTLNSFWFSTPVQGENIQNRKVLKVISFWSLNTLVLLVITGLCSLFSCFYSCFFINSNTLSFLSPFPRHETAKKKMKTQILVYFCPMAFPTAFVYKLCSCFLCFPVYPCFFFLWKSNSASHLPVSRCCCLFKSHCLPCCGPNPSVYCHQIC